MEKVFTCEKNDHMFLLRGFILGALAGYMGVVKLVMKVLSKRETKPTKNMRL